MGKEKAESKQNEGQFKCDTCGSAFGVKSNMVRHMKSHEAKTFQCPDCPKTFTLKPHLQRHQKLHFRPNIPMFKPKEARLAATLAAKEAVKNPVGNVDKVWLSAETAEVRARQLGGGDCWRACVVLTFGRYKGHTFNWLLENDVGWAVWLCSEYVLKGETDDLLKWQKKTLLALCQGFKLIMEKIDKKVKSAKPALPEVCAKLCVYVYYNDTDLKINSSTLYIVCPTSRLHQF